MRNMHSSKETPAPMPDEQPVPANDPAADTDL
jgi:hypothetical protein